MRMSHTYQPLMIQALIDAGGAATIRQLAIEFAKADEPQVRYYEHRIKQMPLPVLKKHGFVEAHGDLVTLCSERLTYEERAELRALCEQKISEFIQRRGLDPYGPRLVDFSSLPESTRYEVLRRDHGRCVLCGASAAEGRRMEVDHVVPRSRGGANTTDNLQTLCDRCNRGKSNRDDTDFRS